MNFSFRGAFPRRLVFSLALATGLLSAPSGVAFAAEAAATPRLGAGAVFETLQVSSGTVYRDVKVRSVNDRTLMISHAGGLAAVRLRDLPPDLQTAFGYSPGAEAAANTALQNVQAAQQKRASEQSATKRNSRPGPAQVTAFEQLLQNFGQPPEVRPGVDLRPKFVELELHVKNQGPRPSCAIFAIVSALEYQNALLSGHPERFSEEYLLWATCKTLHRAPRPRPDVAATAAAEDPENFSSGDEGFGLSEVVTALRAYGVPLQASVPYSFSRTMAVADPSAEVMTEARNRRRVSVLGLPGHDQSTVLANLVQALNAGMPVAVGMRWPARTLGGYLNSQKPSEDGGHAVTIVGYENKTGAIADTVFIFKNSWGVRWGAGGYGFATYRYLFSNLFETALLEVSAGSDSTSGHK